MIANCSAAAGSLADLMALARRPAVAVRFDAPIGALIITAVAQMLVVFATARALPLGPGIGGQLKNKAHQSGTADHDLLFDFIPSWLACLCR